MTNANTYARCVRRIENNVNRGQAWHITKIIRAESDSLEELQE